MHSECRVFISASLCLSEWITDQPFVKEESLTDWLLYRLSKNLPSLKYKEFNRHEEARTGADWEWWLIGNSKSLCLRIQAKKLKNGHDNYPSLAYSNNHGLQIKKLMEDSARANALPFYIFYTKPLTSNLLCKGWPWETWEFSSVLMASAQRINSNFIEPGKRFVSDADIGAQSNPYQYLVCCPLSSGVEQDPVSSIYKHLTSYYAEIFESTAVNNEKVGLHIQLPQYVERLLETTIDEEEISRDEEYQRRLPEVKSILVWDLRK